MESERPVDILVIEDEPCLREMMRMVLSMSGYEAALVDNGLQAIEYLDNGGKARLILLDMMMPVMDGLQFLNWLKAQQHLLGKVPVIVLSACDPVQIEAEKFDAFANIAEFIQKPVVVPQLLQAIHRALSPHA